MMPVAVPLPAGTPSTTRASSDASRLTNYSCRDYAEASAPGHSLPSSLILPDQIALRRALARSRPPYFIGRESKHR